MCYIRFHVQIRKGSLSIHGLLISLRTGFFCSQVRLTSTSSRKINKILQFFEFVPPGILSSPMYVFVYLRVSRKCTLRIRSQLKTNKTARQQWTNDKTVEWKQKAVCELLKERFVHSNCAVFCARHAFRRRFFCGSIPFVVVIFRFVVVCVSDKSRVDMNENSFIKFLFVSHKVCVFHFFRLFLFNFTVFFRYFTSIKCQ